MPNSCFILENDKETIANLLRIIEEFPAFTCLGTSKDYEQGMNTILKFVPDIVFINVDSKPGKEFQDVFSYCRDISEHIEKKPLYVAISNDERMAYKAIKNRFFDYLIKPGKELEIRKIILQILKSKDSFLTDVVCLKSYKDYTILDINNILFLQADNNATDFILMGGNKISAFKTLKFFELALPENFLRIHHSYIVNKNHISRINFGKSKCYLNNIKINLPFSKSYRHNLNSLERLLSQSAFTY